MKSWHSQLLMARAPKVYTYVQGVEPHTFGAQPAAFHPLGTSYSIIYCSQSVNFGPSCADSLERRHCYLYNYFQYQGTFQLICLGLLDSLVSPITTFNGFLHRCHVNIQHRRKKQGLEHKQRTFRGKWLLCMLFANFAIFFTRCSLCSTNILSKNIKQTR